MVRKVGLVIILFIVIVFGVANSFLFFNQGSLSYDYLSGRFIKEIPELPLNINFSIIAFVLQSIILIIIAILTYFHYLKTKIHDNVKVNYKALQKQKGRFETDLDILYKILKEKKRMRINLIAKTFEISEEQALDWGKILEDNKIATLEYPAFYGTELILNEEEMNNEKEVENKNKKAFEGKTSKKEVERKKAVKSHKVNNSGKKKYR